MIMIKFRYHFCRRGFETSPPKTLNWSRKVQEWVKLLYKFALSRYRHLYETLPKHWKTRFNSIVGLSGNDFLNLWFVLLWWLWWIYIYIHLSIYIYIAIPGNGWIKKKVPCSLIPPGKLLDCPYNSCRSRANSATGPLETARWRVGRRW